MPEPRLLAIDTSTDRMAVAVIAGERAWTAEEPGAAASSQRLLPLVLQLLREAGLTPRELQAVAFGRGPGAFTGLRTACSVAQGLAFGAGCGVLAIDSLAIVADDARAAHGVDELWVAMDARMDEVYAGAYRWRGGVWSVRQAPALWTLEALAVRWQAAPPACIAGSALDAFGTRLPVGDARCIAETTDRAAALGRLARTAWQRGEAVDPAQALPLYLRDKVALTTAERERARVAG